jgi:ribosomal protein S18 acetylase RimI-like enzyme
MTILRKVYREDTLSRLAKYQIDTRNKKTMNTNSLESVAYLCWKKDTPVTARLVPYESLNALQRQQVEAIHGALHTLLSKPGPGVKGFALLAEEVPVAFLLLKRPPVLPAWADEHSATLHALQVDHRAQGKGYGKACLHALPEVARQAFPEIKALELSVDADNAAAIALYVKFGWADSGEAYKGRIGYERRMGLIF